MEYPIRKITFNYCKCGHIDAWHTLSSDSLLKGFIHFIISLGEFRYYYNECEICQCPKYNFESNRGINE